MQIYDLFYEVLAYIEQNLHYKLKAEKRTFVIPVFFITNFPAMAIMGSLTLTQKIWAIFAPFLFFVLVRLAWKFSLKHYSSAGG